MTSSAFEFCIRFLTKDDLTRPDLWTQPVSRMEAYYKEQEQENRLVFVAIHKDSIVGYVSLHFMSDDPVFSARAIPEIVDLNVFQSYQNRGIGKALIRTCEENAQNRGWRVIGIGVELELQYAAAQHLYPKLGYIPIEAVSQLDIWALYKKLD